MRESFYAGLRDPLFFDLKEGDYYAVVKEIQGSSHTFYVYNREMGTVRIPYTKLFSSRTPWFRIPVLKTPLDDTAQDERVALITAYKNNSYVLVTAFVTEEDIAEADSDYEARLRLIKDSRAFFWRHILSKKANLLTTNGSWTGTISFRLVGDD